MPLETMMGLAAIDANGEYSSLSVDENGALRLAGAPANREDLPPSPGLRPGSHVLLFLARGPNGNPAPIQLDETGALMTIGGPGGGGGATGDGLTEEVADTLYVQLAGGTLTGPLYFADKPDFCHGFDGTSRYLQWGNGYSDSIEEATGKRYWVGPEGPRMSLDAAGTLGVSGPILVEGPITLEAGAPTEDNHAATKAYVDALQATIAALEARVAALETAATA